MRVAIVLLCLCVGGLPLLLLNGQTFTNALIAIFLFLIATALCAGYARDDRTPRDRRRAWRLATMLTGLLAIVVLFTLPSAYRFQERFNEIRRAIHQARTSPLNAVKPGGSPP